MAKEKISEVIEIDSEEWEVSNNVVKDKRLD